MSTKGVERKCGCGGGECRQCWADMITSDYLKTGKRSYCTCNHRACGTCDIYKKVVAWPVIDGHWQGKEISCDCDNFDAPLEEPLKDPGKDRIRYHRHRTENGFAWSVTAQM